MENAPVVATVAYSRAATQLVLQNLKSETNVTAMTGSNSASKVSYQQFWSSMSDALEEHRLGNVLLRMDNNMTGKELLDMHMQILGGDPQSRPVGLPCCDGCGSTLQPGNCDSTMVRIQAIAKKSRKRQPKRSKRSKTILELDVELETPPNLSEWTAALVNDLKNQLIITCVICGMTHKAPGLLRKENTSLDRPLAAAAKPTTPAVVGRNTGMPKEIVEGRDFVPLEPLLTLSSKKKRKHSQSKKPASKLHDFLNTLMD